MSLVDPWKRKVLPMENGTYHHAKEWKGHGALASMA